MKELNLPKNQDIIRKEKPKGYKIKKISIPKEKLYELYYEQKLSLQKIGELYGKPREYIYRKMRKYGFKSRTKSDAWEHRGKDELYEINEKFFNSWTNEMAYVLGFILTDGNISDENNQVRITIKDVKLLEKIRTKLKSNHPIKYLKADGIYYFSFGKGKMVERLRKLGITSNKSLDIEFPKVPDKFLSHFIRGVFDGDGSVFFESRSKKSPLRVSFTSGSKKFITALEDILHTQAGVSKRTIYKLHRKNTSYYIRYCHKDSLKFFDYIYAGADESMWLERKHRKLLEGMLFTCSITDINKVWDHL